MENNVEELLERGQTLLNLGNPKEASVVYDKILFQESKQHRSIIEKRPHIRKTSKISASNYSL